ncbi:helix-hairpin-helix domain-containing protein [Zunongwangia sp. F363]|uniref:Helix-hairpin-helix domain-containing protein n=1 Tax=Autumnicola tepida TaxID=3075595 RepID=A0ABU3C9W7_9FLAO|nr:helix-hairpin-helix domain-containing protein [Zunongwangia sp. F363]MDT0643002.1 helix-hairpin-helix domain-containing protein [Zunongwangia sp. F363]
MNFFKSHFVFNRSQQNGIFLLVFIIIILQVILFAVDFSSEAVTPEISDHELEGLQKKIDSVKLASAKKDPEIFPFNPNFITDYKGYTLGMSPAEIDRLLAFRESGKWINSAEDFQEVTNVSDALLKKISPYFQFPKWVQQQGKIAAKLNNAISAKVERKDINQAGLEDLMQVNGIGEVLAQRIINYRNKIGGFIDDIQLKDIYGLGYEARENLLREFSVKNEPEIEKKSINTINVLELSEVPYFSYELAREVVNYRNLHSGITSFEELAKISSFPADKIDRIKLYLTLD